MSTNPLVAAFFAQPLPAPKPKRHYRDQAIEDGPDWAGRQCEIPLERIAVSEIGGDGYSNEQERGTLYCPWCPEYPHGCKRKATPERMAAFRAHLDTLKRNNTAADRDRAKCRDHADEVHRQMLDPRAAPYFDDDDKEAA